MSVRKEFVEFVLDQLAPVGGVRSRAMFGGYGIYQRDTIFAITVDERLYFKADSVTRAEFAARGLGPFTYSARGKTMTMQYYEAPPEVFEEPEAMLEWAQQAIGVALRAKSGKRGKAQ
ncbi:MAG: TfoX/Sxy family protein [Gammaproteobacteria bacterium]|nr:TfoX/Sxy family protein [Gammaproteobacteria bacterium]